MKKKISSRVLWSLFFAFQFHSVSFAVESAVRQPNEDWTVALARQMATVNLAELTRDNSTRRTVLSSAVSYTTNFDVSVLPEWTRSLTELDAEFREMRDERVYYSNSQSDFPRRTHWLYPDDGCYTRAVHAARSFENENMQRPGKIFAFGQLKLKTPYSPRGFVYWSYHVVSAYRVGQKAYVFDAAVEPSRPLTLEEWLKRFSSNPTKVKVAVCDTYAYVPGSICIGGSPNQESGATRHQKPFLDVEWQTLQSLKYDPTKLLGEDPPWKKKLIPVNPIGFIDPIRDNE